MSRSIPPGKGQGGKGSQNSDDGIITVAPSETTHVTDPEITAAAEKVREAAFKKAKDERDVAEAEDTIMNPDVVIKSTPESYTDEWIEEQLEWIPGRFEPYLTPHPFEIEDLIETMGEVAGMFDAPGNKLTNSDLSEAYGNAKDRSGGWEGRAGENFATYMSGMPIIFGNHGRVANMLQIEAQKMAELYKNRRKNAKDIADQAVKAIEAINESKGSVVEFLLAVVIVAGTMVGLGGGGLAIAGAAVASGATLGGPFIPEDKEELPLGADTVDGVLENMSNALNDLDKSTREQEDLLIEAQKYNESLIRPEISDDSDEKTLLLPMRPDLAGADVEEIKSSFYQAEDDAEDEDGEDGGDDDDDDDGSGSYQGPDDRPDGFDGSWDQTGQYTGKILPTS